MRGKDIEALVRWAFREELPKEAADVGIGAIGCASAWGGIERYGELMTLIDAPANRWGVVPLGLVEAPHPDAVAIGEAVFALDGYEVTMPEGWDPLGGLAGVGADDGERAVLARLLDGCLARAWDRVTRLAEDGRARVLREPVSGLVRRCAILGRPPVWEADAPEVATVKGERGRERWFRRVSAVDAEGLPYEIVLDGWDAKAKRPHPGAYREHYLDPDPLDALVGRAEYEVWHAALTLVAAELAGRLERCEPLPPNRPARPWEAGSAVAGPRVLEVVGSDAERKIQAAQWPGIGSWWRRKK